MSKSLLIEVLQTQIFVKQIKKLHQNQKNDLDGAVKKIIEELLIGEMKKGDLSGIRVYKFKMVGQLTLLAYEFYERELRLILLSLGSHENFYRDLKK